MGQSAAVTVIVALSLSGVAQSRELKSLTRLLTPAEREQCRKTLEPFVQTVIEAARQSKHTCVPWNIFDESPGIWAPDRALVQPDGLAPMFRSVLLKCDETSAGAYSLIRIHVDVTAQMQAFVPESSRRDRELRLWKSASGEEHFYLAGDAHDGGVPVSGLKISVDSKRLPGVFKALQKVNFSSLLQKVSLMPSPRPTAVVSIAPGPATERDVVDTLVNRIAGADAGVIMSSEPTQNSVEIAPETLQLLRFSAPDLEPTLLATFLERQKSGVLPSVPTNVKREDAATLKRVFDTGFWDEFHRIYPGAQGTLHLSPIAFSSDGAQAVIVAHYSAGPLYGHGALYVLQRVADGTWTIIYESILWMS